MKTLHEDVTSVYARGEGDVILVYAYREGRKRECGCLLFDQEQKTFLYKHHQPLTEDILEVVAYGKAREHIISLFTCGGQITIPVPRRRADRILEIIHWFDSTAKSIVSALIFEGTGKA